MGQGSQGRSQVTCIAAPIETSCRLCSIEVTTSDLGSVDGRTEQGRYRRSARHENTALDTHNFSWQDAELGILRAEFLRGTLILHTLPSGLDYLITGSTDRAEVKAEPLSSKSDRGADLASRLISVVEIIKREYVKTLASSKSPRLIGLHQYNEIGCLEDLEPSKQISQVTEGERTANILQALEGKNFLKQKQTPYMKITLSMEPLVDLADKGATYQAPLRRYLSKSAKARAKKKVAKLAEGDSVMAVD